MRLIALPAALAVLAVSLSFGAAQPMPRTLSVEMQDTAFAHRVDTLFGKTPKPDWLTRTTEAEPATAVMDGQPYTVLLACKQHDCANHQFAVMFDKNSMYGLLFTAKDNNPTEELTWLSIGGGPESIDGKSILFAAITGSLYNHPEVFAPHK